MLKFLARIHRDGERWAMLWLYLYVVLIIVVEVVRRFVFGYSSLWGEEAARYAFVYLVWIAAAVGVRNRAHIRFTILIDVVPPRAAAAISAFGHVAIALFACVAVYWSLDPIATSLRFGSVTEGLRLSRAWFLLAVPLGFTLVIARSLEAFVYDVLDFRHGRAPASGEKLFD